ncbi:MAG TPA: tetratricopeptide repeat protein, partial [Phenylobacterium sp.]
GAYYRARALVRLQNAQPLLAKADLDQALNLQPDDASALRLRGELYLRRKDVKLAQADFDAALKSSSANAELPVEIGLAYVGAGFYEAGVRQLDGWITAHPKDENLGQAYAARCWARASWGKELDAALADCDAALRRDHNSRVMEFRGLVLYRMGRLDEAILQYGAAVKLQPRSAAALYGRGLAELKKGARDAGDADLAAAKTLSPGIVEEWRRFGLAPDAPAPAKS